MAVAGVHRARRVGALRRRPAGVVRPRRLQLEVPGRERLRRRLRARSLRGTPVPHRVVAGPDPRRALAVVRLSGTPRDDRACPGRGDLPSPARAPADRRRGAVAGTGLLHAQPPHLRDDPVVGRRPQRHPHAAVPRPGSARHDALRARRRATLSRACRGGPARLLRRLRQDRRVHAVAAAVRARAAAARPVAPSRRAGRLFRGPHARVPRVGAAPARPCVERERHQRRRVGPVARVPDPWRSATGGGGRSVVLVQRLRRSSVVIRRHRHGYGGRGDRMGTGRRGATRRATVAYPPAAAGVGRRRCGRPRDRSWRPRLGRSGGPHSEVRRRSGRTAVRHDRRRGDPAGACRPDPIGVRR